VSYNWYRVRGCERFCNYFNVAGKSAHCVALARQYSVLRWHASTVCCVGTPVQCVALARQYSVLRCTTECCVGTPAQNVALAHQHNVLHWHASTACCVGTARFVSTPAQLVALAHQHSVLCWHASTAYCVGTPAHHVALARQQSFGGIMERCVGITAPNYESAY